jgi:transcriptional repressor of dcmA and dcmR
MRHEPELLDVKQAAALLQVSVASLRRWTNAGRLACFRVGGRRERRFRRVDLLAFLESHPVTTSASRGREPPGHDVVSGHLCGLYMSDLARTRQAARFLADGVRADASFLVAEPGVRKRVLARLERQRPSVHDDIETGRLVLSEYAGSPAAQIEFWHTRFHAATRAGVRSLCVVGDVSGGPLAGRNPFEAALEYEAEYERSVSRRFPVTTLCLYDARALSGLEASRLLQAHGDAFRYPVEHLVG